MNSRVQIPAEKSPRPQVARRRVEVRARLLAVAARRFAERGFDAVRLDEIAVEAQVARGTLYSFFSSKEELLKAIVRPVLERAVELLQQVPAGPPRAALEELLRLHFRLWQVSPDAMRLAHRSQSTPLDELMPLHEAFVRRTLAVFQSAAKAGLLRHGDPVIAARVLAVSAIPVLDVLSCYPDAERRFLESLSGLLLEP